MATPGQVSSALHSLIPNYPVINFGVHLHSTQQNWRNKIEAAFGEGCKRFDGALKGIGGCPMANDTLVGNINTERMIEYFKEKNVLGELDPDALERSLILAEEIFSA